MLWQSAYKYSLLCSINFHEQRSLTFDALGNFYALFLVHSFSQMHLLAIFVNFFQQASMIYSEHVIFIKVALLHYYKNYRY